MGSGVVHRQVLWHCQQCDQIVTVTYFLTKEAQIIGYFLGHFEKYPFWVKNFWTTFYYNKWSHWLPTTTDINCIRCWTSARTTKTETGFDPILASTFRSKSKFRKSKIVISRVVEDIMIIKRTFFKKMVYLKFSTSQFTWQIWQTNNSIKSNQPHRIMKKV